MIIDNEKARRVLEALEKKKLTLGSVESLTGGLFASTLTSVPGASKVFKGSLVTYWSEEKIALADVSATSIRDYGQRWQKETQCRCLRFFHGECRSHQRTGFGSCRTR